MSLFIIIFKKYIHEEDMVHGNLKPENFLFENDNVDSIVNTDSIVNVGSIDNVSSIVNVGSMVDVGNMVNARSISR